MKRNIIKATAAILSLFCAACGPSSNQTEPADTSAVQGFTSNIEGVTVKDGISKYYLSGECTIDSDVIIGIQDRASEMSIDLFKGSYNDSLLQTLLPEGSSKSAINVFLFNNLQHNILFDAGLGTQSGGALMDKLDTLGINPSDIDAVCLTHLHGDHIGGLLVDGKAAFPKATLYLSQKEFDAWNDQGAMSKQNDLWKQVQAAYTGRIKSFADRDTIIDGLIATIPAPGHTPGHTVYQVGNCLIAGDIIHSEDLQFQHPDFCARYDNDPAAAVKTRKEILQYASSNRLLFCDAHCYDHFIQL